MGDRCWIRINLRKRDLEKFNAAAEWDEDMEDIEEVEGTDSVSFQVDEVNYGADDALDAASGAGIRFYGQHGAGGAYGSEVFVCDGKELHTLNVAEDGYTSVRYDPETGEPVDELGDKAEIKRFATRLRRIKRYVDKETDG